VSDLDSVEGEKIRINSYYRYYQHNSEQSYQRATEVLKLGESYEAISMVLFTSWRPSYVKRERSHIYDKEINHTVK